MKLFLDCEFADYKGDLVSLALVSEQGHEFYVAVDFDRVNDWVSKNVLTVLDTNVISVVEGQKKLEEFLSQFEEVEIIADWPEDISYFCDFLITGPGERINTPILTMKVFRGINSDNSAIPHNALADARAIRESYNDTFII